MHQLWQWIVAHPGDAVALVVEVVVGIVVLASVVNGAAKHDALERGGRVRRALGVLVDLAAATTRKDSPGTFKAPLRHSLPPPRDAIATAPPSSPPPAAVIRRAPEDVITADGHTDHEGFVRRETLALLGAITLAFMPLLIAATLQGCPRLPPPDGCTPRAQRCHEGVPQVCSPTGRWTPADRPCALNGAVCCATASAYGGRPVHACVPVAACLPTDGGAP
jgi:hypothetical protein